MEHHNRGEATAGENKQTEKREDSGNPHGGFGNQREDGPGCEGDQGGDSRRVTDHTEAEATPRT